jgi:vitamin B12 transporter
MRFAVFLCPALLAHAGSAIAQSADIHAQPVVVTATRTAQTADEALASVTVITHEDIKQRQWQDIVDLLRTQAGVDITQSGGPGGNVDVFMRGAKQSQMLVLIDGVRVASMTNGAFEWRSLPLSQVERIEIVRGPRASLYGSDAIGGVIQIFTRRSRGAEAMIGVGSDATHRSEVAWGGGTRARTFITGSRFITGGFSAQNENGFSFDADNDGANMEGVSAGLDTELTPNTRLEVTGRQSRGNSEFDIGESRIANGSLNARLSHTASIWHQSLSLGVATDKLVTKSSSDVTTRRQQLDWQNDFAIADDSTITAGLTYVKESGKNTDLTTDSIVLDSDQHNRALFAIWQQRFGNHDLQLSGRHDDFSSFGGHGTWSAAYGYAWSVDTRGWMSYGTGFHAPTLNELFHPGYGGGAYAGNPDLKPERSRTAELGLRHRISNGNAVSFAVFSTQAEDLIANEGVNNQAINIATASMRGLEIEHAYGTELWHASTAITLQRAINEETDEPLLRRADSKLSTFLERRFEQGALGAELVAISEREDSGTSVHGYGILNLTARMAITKQLLLEGRVENALDKEYQIINGYNTQNRALFVSLRYQPK